MHHWEYITPMEIEKRSFSLISEQLGSRTYPPMQEAVIKRVIHTTADFDYADTLTFHKDAIKNAIDAIKAGTWIATDTSMAASGINKRVLSSFGGKVVQYIGDEDVREIAKEKNITRSMAAMDKAAKEPKVGIYVVGNAPTALIRLYELVQEKKIVPKLVVGVPVGFVNVVEAKELFISSNVPYIISRGRKGGSNVAAAIVNALIYLASENRRE